jgi:hypothetical protein
MNDLEKSDSAIVAAKPPNKAGSPAAEAVEGFVTPTRSRESDSSVACRSERAETGQLPALAAPRGSQVRNGFAAGANRIRTLGPPARGTV